MDEFGAKRQNFGKIRKLYQARTVLWGIEESSPPPPLAKNLGNSPPLGHQKKIFYYVFH